MTAAQRELRPPFLIEPCVQAILRKPQRKIRTREIFRGCTSVLHRLELNFGIDQAVKQAIMNIGIVSPLDIMQTFEEGGT